MAKCIIYNVKQKTFLGNDFNTHHLIICKKFKPKDNKDIVYMNDIINNVYFI